MADARRAVWLEDHRTLLVSDVHLGHFWVERQRGTLLPIVPEDTLHRLDVLGREYRPARWIFLGDVVHAAARLPVLEEELRRLVRWQETENVTFVLGNHDVGLPEMLRTLGCTALCTRLATVGPHVLVHGDGTPWACVRPHLGRGGYVFYGHEHPALVLGDGVATSARVPCFLVGPDRVVLPAFSRWAAGQVFPVEPMLSPLSTPADFDHAVAVLGERLVPVRLGAAAQRKPPTTGIGGRGHK
ncbi:MAG: metallophosphoesterase [Verrucomicrobiales bacterium]|nr:metallophosphoesterase [Verrucomicrobiales bacterium]